MSKLMRFKNFESVLKFSDGVNVDTSGELRTLELQDGWYVTGKGFLIPVKDETEANTLLKQMQDEEAAKMA